MNIKNFEYKYLISVVVLVLWVFLVYWQGLPGDFEYDDGWNILQNKDLVLQKITSAELWRAASSGESGVLGRPISMLSFALNIYLTGYDPFWFKLTNIAIHALSGVMVFIVSVLLIRCLVFVDGKYKEFDTFLPPFIVALLWAVSPVNLTSVLYIVQRMTALSGLFVYAGVAGYLYGRLQLFRGQFKGWAWMVFGMIVCTTFAVFSKENGLLLPLFILVAECTLFRNFHLLGVNIYEVLVRKISNIALAFLVVILLVLPFYFFGHINEMYQGRDFSLDQRMLTQSRVLLFYLKLTFLPSISDFGIYHDDFVLSRHILTPASTLFSCLAIFISLGVSFFFRKKIPLLFFGLAWFLVGHVMESTVWPLELVYEHRNYVPIYGLLFTAVLLLFKSREGDNRVLRLLKVVPYLAVVVLTLITVVRANQWSSLFDHAIAEQSYHPMSERANYQLGRLCSQLYEKDKKDIYFNCANKYFLMASQSSPGISGAFALIPLYGLAGRQLPNGYLDAFKSRLRGNPLQGSNIVFLRALVQCQAVGKCQLSKADLAEVLEAATQSKSVAKSIVDELHSMLIAVYINDLNNYHKAIDVAIAGLRLNKTTGNYMNLAEVYLISGDYAKAIATLNEARSLDVDGKSRLIIEKRLMQIKNEVSSRGPK